MIVFEHLVAGSRYEHREQAISFHREFNPNWGQDQLSYTLHHPPRESYYHPTSDRYGAGASMLPVGPVHVTYRAGFEITSDRKDELKTHTYRIHFEERVLVEEALRRLEVMSASKVKSVLETRKQQLQRELQQIQKQIAVVDEAYAAASST